MHGTTPGFLNDCWGIELRTFRTSLPSSPGYSCLASQPWMETVFAACAQTGRLVHMTGLSHGGHPRALGLGDRNSCTSTPEGLNCLFPSEVRIERIFSEFPVLPFVNVLLLLKFTYIPCRGISRTDGSTGECTQCWGISEGCSAKSWAPRANDEFKSGI